MNAGSYCLSLDLSLVIQTVRHLVKKEEDHFRNPKKPVLGATVTNKKKLKFQGNMETRPM